MVIWEYPTNFSNGTTVDGLGNLVGYMANVTEGWFAFGFLLLIFMMSFGFTALTGSRKALLSSSFITFIFSIYFVRLGVSPLYITFILMVLIIIGAIGAKEERGY